MKTLNQAIKEAKHFELTSESKVDSFGRTLFRVKLTIDCRWGKKCTLGGWVEKAENLEGNAWVTGDAQISDNAKNKNKTL